MKKGFTLVELLVYMGLFSILIVVLTEIFLSILELQSQSVAVSSVASDGRFIVSRLTYDIRRATTISQPASLGQTGATAQLLIGGANYALAGSGGNLVLTSPLGSDNLNSIGSQVTDLSFTRVGNVGGKNSLQIKFRVTSRQNLPQGAEVRDYETTVSLR